VSWIQRTVANQLARRGFEVRRHSATRRQAVLSARGVDLVLDVGAARGGYGSELRRFGYAGRIVSFEPLADAFRSLSRQIADDPLWSAHNVALGAEPGTATINVASNSDSSSLLPMLDAHRAAAPSVTYVAGETIKVERLDDVCADVVGTAQSAFLKLDTQGFERAVLQGGPETVARCVGLQLELSFIPLYGGGMLADEAISWAYDQGFQLVGMEQGYAAPTGQILQMDGVFMRGPEA
jgi:FkbM family methyltransferase